MPGQAYTGREESTLADLEFHANKVPTLCVALVAASRFLFLCVTYSSDVNFFPSESCFGDASAHRLLPLRHRSIAEGRVRPKLARGRDPSAPLAGRSQDGGRQLVASCNPGYA